MQATPKPKVNKPIEKYCNRNLKSPVTISHSNRLKMIQMLEHLPFGFARPLISDDSHISDFAYTCIPEEGEKLFLIHVKMHSTNMNCAIISLSFFSLFLCFFQGLLQLLFPSLLCLGFIITLTSILLFAVFGRSTPMTSPSLMSTPVVVPTSLVTSLTISTVASSS